MRQQYLALLLLAILAVFGGAGCAILHIGDPTATPLPFDLYTAEDVFNAFARAGLQVANPEKNMVAGRGAPIDFRDRYVFEVPRIAPAGGQIVIFASPDQLQAWQSYITKLSSDSATHRDVIYVYVKANIMLQLSANLTNQEAASYRDALMSLG